MSEKKPKRVVAAGRRPWPGGTVTVMPNGIRAGFPHTFGFLLVGKNRNGSQIWERPDGQKVTIDAGEPICRTADGRWVGGETA